MLSSTNRIATALFEEETLGTCAQPALPAIPDEKAEAVYDDDDLSPSSAGFSVCVTIKTPVTLVRVIGAGGFATVHEATYQGVTIAVKRLNEFPGEAEYFVENAIDLFYREVDILREIDALDMRCTVKYLGCHQDLSKKTPVRDIFLEFVKGKALGDFVNDHWQQVGSDSQYEMPPLLAMVLTLLKGERVKEYALQDTFGDFLAAFLADKMKAEVTRNAVIDQLPSYPLSLFSTVGAESRGFLERLQKTYRDVVLPGVVAQVESVVGLR